MFSRVEALFVSLSKFKIIIFKSIVHLILMFLHHKLMCFSIFYNIMALYKFLKKIEIRIIYIFKFQVLFLSSDCMIRVPPFIPNSDTSPNTVENTQYH